MSYAGDLCWDSTSDKGFQEALRALLEDLVHQLQRGQLGLNVALVERQTDTQTDRQTHRGTNRIYRQTDRQTDIQTDRQTERQTKNKTHRKKNRETSMETEGVEAGKKDVQRVTIHISITNRYVCYAQVYTHTVKTGRWTDGLYVRTYVCLYIPLWLKVMTEPLL